MRASRRRKPKSNTEPISNAAPADSPRLQVAVTATVLIVAYLLAVGASALSGDQMVPPLEQLLDYSWTCDMTSQLVDGRIAGRDFVYTYGPLRQVLHGLGAIVGSGDLATRARMDRVLIAAVAVAGLWWLLAQTRAPLAWRAVLLLAWFACDYEIHAKPLTAVFIAAGCGRQLAPTANPGQSWLRRAWPRIAWGIAPPVATLYCFDLGVFVAAALGAVGIAVILATAGLASREASQARRRSLMLTACMLFGATLFVVALQLPFGWQSYLRDSLSVATGYIDQLPYPIAPTHFVLLIVAGVAALGTIAFAVRGLRQTWRGGRSAEPWVYEQLSIGCLSLLLLRYALTRSDPPHVVDALLPTILWWGCLAPARWSAHGSNEESWQGAWWRVARWGLPLLILVKVMIAPQAIASTWRASGDALGVMARQSPRLVVDEPTDRAVAAARSLPGHLLAVWPNESFLAQAAGKRNPLYTLQTFMDMNPHLEQATLGRLKQIPDTPVLLVRTSSELDQVSNVARSPEFFRYLVEHYELSQPPLAEFAVLRPATNRGWQSQQVPFPNDKQTARLIDGEIITLDLSKSGQDIRGTDLIFLKIATAKPPWNPIGKGARLLIKLTFDTGEYRVRNVPLVQDGREHTIGISCLEPREPLFVAAFSPGTVFRSRERVARIDIIWQPVDFLTPLPDELILLEFETLRRQGSPVVEVSLDDQSKIDEAIGLR